MNRFELAFESGGEYTYFEYVLERNFELLKGWLEDDLDVALNNVISNGSLKSNSGKKSKL